MAGPLPVTVQQGLEPRSWEAQPLGVSSGASISSHQIPSQDPEGPRLRPLGCQEDRPPGCLCISGGDTACPLPPIRSVRKQSPPTRATMAFQIKAEKWRSSLTVPGPAPHCTAGETESQRTSSRQRNAYQPQPG